MIKKLQKFSAKKDEINSTAIRPVLFLSSRMGLISANSADVIILES